MWLYLAQCVLAMWRPVGGFEARKEAQPGVNTLVTDIVETDTTPTRLRTWIRRATHSLIAELHGPARL